tara:strand:- start:61323 stop:61817 length:495 start_codon:yes stop_codon:yes gene_type:complete
MYRIWQQNFIKLKLLPITMHAYHKIEDHKRSKHYEEVIREDSDLISMRGFVGYLKQGAKKAVTNLVKRVSGKSDDLDDRLQGCSVVFETLENDSYFLEVIVHEKFHGEEFIVQGNFYAKTNGHYSIDNIVEAPRVKFEGQESRTLAYIFASDFISKISAKYNLD